MSALLVNWISDLWHKSLIRAYNLTASVDYTEIADKAHDAAAWTASLDKKMIFFYFIAFFALLIGTCILLVLIWYARSTYHKVGFWSSLGHKTIHNWRKFSSSSQPKYCNGCKKLISGFWIFRNTGFECEICGRASHPHCLLDCERQECKTPSRTSPSEHVFVQGNLVSDAVCCVCGIICASSFALVGLRCLWCSRTCHEDCKFRVARHCDFGPHRSLILPPFAVALDPNLVSGWLSGSSSEFLAKFIPISLKGHAENAMSALNSFWSNLDKKRFNRGLIKTFRERIIHSKSTSTSSILPPEIKSSKSAINSTADSIHTSSKQNRTPSSVLTLLPFVPPKATDCWSLDLLALSILSSDPGIVSKHPATAAAMGIQPLLIKNNSASNNNNNTNNNISIINNNNLIENEPVNFSNHFPSQVNVSNSAIPISPLPSSLKNFMDFTSLTPIAVSPSPTPLPGVSLSALGIISSSNFQSNNSSFSSLQQQQQQHQSSSDVYDLEDPGITHQVDFNHINNEEANDKNNSGCTNTTTVDFMCNNSNTNDNTNSKPIPSSTSIEDVPFPVATTIVNSQTTLVTNNNNNSNCILLPRTLSSLSLLSSTSIPQQRLRTLSDPVSTSLIKQDVLSLLPDPSCTLPFDIPPLSVDSIMLQHGSSSSPNCGSSPCLVFVNAKSGGQLGSRLMHHFFSRLNPLQVVDIQAEKGPRRGLKLFKPLISSQRLKIIVCGGDGTACWVMDEQLAMNQEEDEKENEAVMKLLAAGRKDRVDNMIREGILRPSKWTEEKEIAFTSLLRLLSSLSQQQYHQISNLNSHHKLKKQSAINDGGDDDENNNTNPTQKQQEASSLLNSTVQNSSPAKHNSSSPVINSASHQSDITGKASTEDVIVTEKDKNVKNSPLLSSLIDPTNSPDKKSNANNNPKDFNKKTDLNQSQQIAEITGLCEKLLDELQIMLEAELKAFEESFALNILRTRRPPMSRRVAPIAMLPLGTGNDLAQVLGWGAGFNPDVDGLLRRVSNARVGGLDRWEVRGVSLHDGKEFCKLKFNNYMDIGTAARVTLKFHKLREAHPELFQSQVANKFIYGEAGFRDFIVDTPIDLSKCRLEVDGVDIPLHEETLSCLVLVNIPSFAGAVNLWPTPAQTSQSRMSTLPNTPGIPQTDIMHHAIPPATFRSHRRAESLPRVRGIIDSSFPADLISAKAKNPFFIEKNPGHTRSSTMLHDSSSQNLPLLRTSLHRTSKNRNKHDLLGLRDNRLHGRVSSHSRLSSVTNVAMMRHLHDANEEIGLKKHAGLLFRYLPSAGVDGGHLISELEIRRFQKKTARNSRGSSSLAQRIFSSSTANGYDEDTENKRVRIMNLDGDSGGDSALKINNEVVPKSTILLNQSGLDDGEKTSDLSKKESSHHASRKGSLSGRHSTFSQDATTHHHLQHTTDRTFKLNNQTPAVPNANSPKQQLSSQLNGSGMYRSHSATLIHTTSKDWRLSSSSSSDKEVYHSDNESYDIRHNDRSNNNLEDSLSSSSSQSLCSSSSTDSVGMTSSSNGDSVENISDSDSDDEADFDEEFDDVSKSSKRTSASRLIRNRHPRLRSIRRKKTRSTQNKTPFNLSESTDSDNNSRFSKFPDFPSVLEAPENETYVVKGRLWRQQSTRDGIIEMIGVRSTFHLGQVQVGLAEPIRIAQGRSVKLTIFEELPMQVDGEPRMIPPCELHITHCAQVPVLHPIDMQALRGSKAPVSGIDTQARVSVLKAVGAALEGAVSRGELSYQQRLEILNEIATGI